MPELPEVETIVRQLTPLLQGRKLHHCVIFDPKLLSPTNANINRLVSNVFREGKQIVIQLEHRGGKPMYLCFHLRMTGRLLWCPSKNETKFSSAKVTSEKPNLEDKNATGISEGAYFYEVPFQNKHLRAALIFQGGKLLFVDPRRFGTFVVGQDRSLFQSRGIDPLSDKFSLQVLGDLCQGKTQVTKQWLLRQDCIVGVGNIYASEILFQASIDPSCVVKALSASQLRKLYRAVRDVLLGAIASGGTTFSDYQDSFGKQGSFQKLLKVYDRENLPCRRCRTPIRRRLQQGRSTFFCPQCQE